MAAEDARSRRLMQLQGIGCTTASALVATIGHGREPPQTPGQFTGAEIKVHHSK